MIKPQYVKQTEIKIAIISVFNPHQHSLMGTIRRKPFLTRSCRTQRFNPDQLVIVYNIQITNMSTLPPCVVSNWFTHRRPSSSCEMIILRNKSDGEIIRVCVGIFTTALMNKKEKLLLCKFRNSNSLKWALFNIVSGQVASDKLWK